MPRDHEPASMHLRMSPQLLESVRHAAQEAGCSLNAFAVQVLAASVGDASGFRSDPEPRPQSDGVPAHQQWRRREARNEFMGVMGMEIGGVAMAALVKRFDADDPGYFLRWKRDRDAAGGHGEPGASRTVA